MTIQVLLGATASNLSTTTTQNIPFWGYGSGRISTGEVLAVPVPCDITVRNLRVNLTVAPGGTTSRTFTVLKNGSATGVTVTITGAGTTQTDSTHSFTAVASDYLQLQSTLS